MAGERGGIIRAFHKAGRALVMLLCAVFALSMGAGQAHASVADANRAIGVAKALIALTPQSLGAKLRTAELVARNDNAAINPPWVIAGAWTAGANYVKGNVETNGGHHYVELNANCTAAGSGGPTNTTAVAQTDNTCSWMYIGEPQITASDANAPAVSTSSTGNVFGASATSLFYPALYPSAYDVRGATTSVLATNYWNFSGFNNKSGNNISYGFTVCTDVTDSKFAVGFTNGSQPASVIIDRRHYSPQVQFQTTGTPNWIIFDFTGTTGYRKRNVCVQGYSNTAFSFAGVTTTNHGFISLPTTAGRVKAAFIWDSYDAGSSYGPFSAYGTLGAQLGQMLGWTATAMGQGSTGLQNAGSTCSTTCYTYIQRAQDAGNAATLAQQDVILFNVSTNDAGMAGEQAAVTALLAALRAINPTALIVGMGPAPINPGSPTYAQTQALDTAGAAGFAAWSDPAGVGKACYISFANAAVQPILSASYQTGAPTNADTKSVLISSGDNTHPTDLGTSVIAKWAAAQIPAQCFQSLP